MKTVAIFGFFLSAAIAASVSEDLFIKDEDEPFGNNSVNQELIFNGKAAAPGQFPYQVGILITTVDQKHRFCGGSVISNTWVLTAAHCLASTREVILYFGSIKRFDGAPIRLATDRNFHKHPDYDGLRNDIALIAMAPVFFSSSVNKVLLPPLSSKSNYIGETAIISGWGLLGDPPRGQQAQHLQYGPVRIIDNSVCAYMYGASNVVESNICGLTNDLSSTCGGDSGGPVVSNNVQIGVINYGHTNGCSKGIPEVFARMTSYLPWIKSVSGVSY